jgi:hypothetical protein
MCGGLFLISRFRWLCLGVFSAALSGSAAGGTELPVVLENDQVSVAFDPVAGVLTGIRDKPSGIEVAPAAGLAENFRVVVLRPDKSTATILGKDQKLSGVDRTTDGLVLRWDGPLKDRAGAEHPLAVRMNVAAVGNELRFELRLDNHTGDRVKEAWYPLIGGLSKFGAPSKPADGVLWLPTTATNKIGLPFKAQALGYPGQMSMAFTCIQSATANKSLYFASHDTVARYKVFHFAEHTNNTARDVFACIEHRPFTAPGQSFAGSTVVARVVDGDWRGASQVYRAWFEKTFGICKPSECWLRRESFFQFSMFELPEGTINYRFKDIPRWAKDAKDHGLNSVQISGWQVGGHDNGYPDYTPDPRLGTWKELADGLKACHKLGLKVYFFVNYQPVMIESDWYKRELIKYHEWRGPNGGVTWNVGWPMGTVWGRMGHPKRMVWADPAFPQYRRIIVNQFAKLAQIGADGVHVDKMFPSALDYNPDLPLSPDTATWEGAITLTKEVFAACRKYNPDWAMSFECNWDRMMQFTCSTWWAGGFNRSVFPDSVGMLAITSPYDYLGVNNLVCAQSTVMAGPLNFCRSVGWKPWAGLADYMKEVKRIQDGLADVVWLGDALGQDGVRLDGPVACAYYVFRNRATGKRVCIFSNASRTARKQSFQGFVASGSRRVRLHTPFAPAKTVALPAEIGVPGERMVFVEEMGDGRIDDLPIVSYSPEDSALPAPVFPRFDPKKSIRLEDDRYLVEVSRSHGSISRIRDKQSGLDLIGDARLGDSFRFTLPIPGKEPWQTIEANYIWGKDQKLRSCDVGATNLTLHWGRPLLNYLGEKFDAAAAMDIALTADGILFALRIDNATRYPIGELFFPVVGGVRGLGKTGAQLAATQFVHPTGSNAVASDNIFRVFVNNPNSWLGDQGPEQFHPCPKELAEPWMELFAPQLERSAYLGARDPVHRSLVLRLELVPGNSQTLREDGNWPRPSELKGQPVGVSLCFVDFANSPANRTYEAAPVLVTFHDGSRKKSLSSAGQGAQSDRGPSLSQLSKASASPGP